MMEYTAASQDGNCGGLQLLQAGRSVVFCGRAKHASNFSVGPSFDAPEASLRPTTLVTAQPGELYRTHYFRLVIEYGETSDEARLESYSMYGLPTAAPVVYSAEDLSFDAVAIVLDDYQVDEVVVRREAAVDQSPVHYRPTRNWTPGGYDSVLLERRIPHFLLARSAKFPGSTSYRATLSTGGSAPRRLWRMVM